MRPITRAQWEHVQWLGLDWEEIDDQGNPRIITYDRYIELFHEHPPERQVVVS